VQSQHRLHLSPIIARPSLFGACVFPLLSQHELTVQLEASTKRAAEAEALAASYSEQVRFSPFTLISTPGMPSLSCHSSLLATSLCCFVLVLGKRRA